MKTNSMNRNTLDEKIAEGRRAKHTRSSHKRVTYLDCITGKAPVPTEVPRKTLFQAMMVIGMVSFMFTFNWALHADPMTLHGLLGNAYKYPIMICIAFTLRQLFANAFSKVLIDKLLSKVKGVRKTAGITLINIMIMAPIMSVFGSMLNHGGIDGLSLAGYASSLALAMPMAFIINFFVVAPLVKATYCNIIEPRLDAHAATAKKIHASAANRY